MKKTKYTFESAMKRLEEISALMDIGDLGLDDTIKLFKEGTELSKMCKSMLDEAELEVKMLVEGENGSTQLVDFESKDMGAENES